MSRPGFICNACGVRLASLAACDRHLAEQGHGLVWLEDVGDGGRIEEGAA